MKIERKEFSQASSRLSESLGLGKTKAQEELARAFGYKSYNVLSAELSKEEGRPIKNTPKPSKEGIYLYSSVDCVNEYFGDYDEKTAGSVLAYLTAEDLVVFERSFEAIKGMGITSLTRSLLGRMFTFSSNAWMQDDVEKDIENGNGRELQRIWSENEEVNFRSEVHSVELIPAFLDGGKNFIRLYFEPKHCGSANAYLSDDIDMESLLTSVKQGKKFLKIS